MKEKYVCYCFRHTREALAKDAEKHGRSTIMEQIIADSRTGHCNCEINNPKGR